MDLNKDKQPAPTGRSHKKNHEKILAALRKEYDYDTGFSGRGRYQYICKRLEEIEDPPNEGPRTLYSPQLREKLLAEKSRFENTPYLMNRPSSFAAQVHMDVEYLVKLKLNKNVPNLPQKITFLMRRWGHDLQWIKDKLDLHTSRIHDFLNTEKPITTISPFYLEVFCLIFFCDVYDFLGLRGNERPNDTASLYIPLSTPLIPADGPEYVYYKFIMNRFADRDNEEKLSRLRLITKIAKLKAEKYQIFMYIASQIPTLNKALLSKLPDLSNEMLDEPLKSYILRASKKYEDDDTPDKTQPYYTIAEAGQFLRYLTRFDLERMEVLAHFAHAGNTVWRILSAILIDGNFPCKSTSLHSKLDTFIA